MNCANGLDHFGIGGTSPIELKDSYTTSFQDISCPGDLQGSNFKPVDPLSTFNNADLNITFTMDIFNNNPTLSAYLNVFSIELEYCVNNCGNGINDAVETCDDGNI